MGPPQRLAETLITFQASPSLSGSNVAPGDMGSEAALHAQVTSGRETLFPLRLDHAVLASETQWARRVCLHHIGDLTGWQDEITYQAAFSSLLRHLKVSTLPPS